MDGNYKIPKPKQHNQHNESKPPLGSREQTHLKALITQSLQELYLPPEKWTPILMKVCFLIAEDVPYVVDVLASEKRPLLTENDKVNRHRIRVETVLGKDMSMSTYVSAPIPTNPLASAFTPPSASMKMSQPQQRGDLGGKVILASHSSTDISRLEKVIPLLVFVTCHLKLEMSLFQDSFVKDISSNPKMPDQGSGMFPGIRKRGRQIRGSILSWINSASLPSNSEQKLNLSDSGQETSLNAQSRFSRTIQMIESTLLSASPGIHFPPPLLLLQLRDQENLTSPSLQQEKDLFQDLDLAFHGTEPHRPLLNPNNKISVDTKAALQYLMTNNNSISGVIRHQRISYAYSFFRDAEAAIPCQTSKVMTIQYYQTQDTQHPDQGHAPPDKTLGEYIEHLYHIAETPCSNTSCNSKMLEHTFTYTHGNASIQVSLSRATESNHAGLDHARIFMWTSCNKCHHETMLVPISNMTWYMSFAKFLEVLFYNETYIPTGLCFGGVDACHRELMKRKFRIGDLVVTFSYKKIELFELRVPRIQLEHHLNLGSEPVPFQRPVVNLSKEVHELTLEINAFYCSLKQYVSTLEEALLNMKSDSIKSSYQTRTISSSIVSSAVTLPVAIANSITSTFGGRPSSVSFSPDLDQETTSMSSEYVLSESPTDVKRNVQYRRSMSYLTTTSHQHTLFNMLQDLMQCLGDEERSVQREAELFRHTSRAYELNDFRRRFCDWISRAVENVTTWQKEYLPLANGTVSDLAFPDYYAKKDTLVSNTFVLMKEDHPCSIIATSLSSLAYQSCFESMKSTEWTSLAHDFETSVHAFHHENANGDPYTPHIKLKLRNKSHLIACTIYYAREFHLLRQKCGIADTYVHSLSRSTPWKAKGGKSRSRFFRTCDDQLVLKELASKWTLVEKDALLRFAPAYFDYLNGVEQDGGTRRPSLLAKIFGVYAVKMTNLSTGQIQKKDYLVMEHLFANTHVSRMFDLKGIPDRHFPITKPTPGKDNETDSETSAESKVMWDGDWVDGRYKSLLRLHAHSKKILLEAIDADTEFLARANVMDYSLLVGVNDKNRELIVGIVDFIGPYTWYKALESRGKTTINATLRGGKEATVLPPTKYRKRFQKAMDQNFIMVPDKWMKIADKNGKELGATSYHLPPVI